MCERSRGRETDGRANVVKVLLIDRLKLLQTLDVMGKQIKKIILSVFAPSPSPESTPSSP